MPRSALVFSLGEESENFPTQLLCLPHAVPKTAVLLGQTGRSAEELGSCGDVEVSSSCWIGLYSLTQGRAAFQQVPAFVASGETGGTHGSGRTIRQRGFLTFRLIAVVF